MSSLYRELLLSNTCLWSFVAPKGRTPIQWNIKSDWYDKTCNTFLIVRSCISNTNDTLGLKPNRNQSNYCSTHATDCFLYVFCFVLFCLIKNNLTNKLSSTNTVRFVHFVHWTKVHFWLEDIGCLCEMGTFKLLHGHCTLHIAYTCHHLQWPSNYLNNLSSAHHQYNSSDTVCICLTFQIHQA